MPVKRRVSKSRRAELTRCQKAHLLTGWFAVGLNGTASRYRTLEEFTAAWREHRAELLPEYIERHPGHRPFAWWRCEHGELPLNEDGLLLSADELDRLRWGSRHREPFHFLHGSEYQVDETEYLRAHGLLMPEEAGALANEPNE